MHIYEQKNIKIFYADDDPDDTFFFESAANEIDKKIKLSIFTSGVALLEKANFDSSFHTIIFLDVNMPLKNGLECLRDIRDNSVWDSVPVFIMSTSNSDILKEKALMLGAAGYIEKPTDFKKLKEKIREALRSTMV